MALIRRLFMIWCVPQHEQTAVVGTISASPAKPPNCLRALNWLVLERARFSYKSVILALALFCYLTTATLVHIPMAYASGAITTESSVATPWSGAREHASHQLVRRGRRRRSPNESFRRLASGWLQEAVCANALAPMLRGFSLRSTRFP